MIREKESENVVLGYLITHPEAMAEVMTKNVRTSHFMGDAGKVAAACFDLFDQGHLSNRTIRSEMKARGIWDELGGEQSITALEKLGWGDESFSYHLDRIKKAHKLRGREAAMGKALNELRKEHRNLESKESATEDALKELLKISSEDVETVATGRDMAESTDELTSGEKNILSPTGLWGFDDEIKGIHVGRINVFAGRTDHGKGVTTDTIAMNHAIRYRKGGENKQVLKFDLENGRDMAHARFLAMLSYREDVPEGQMRGVPISRLMQRINGDIELSSSEYDRLEEAKEKLGELPLVIDTQGGVDSSYVKARMMAQSADTQVGLVIVDYMGLMSAPGKNKTERIENALRDLHEITKEFEIPMIAVSQTNREPTHRQHGVPHLNDLSWSDSLAKYPALVAMVNHPYQHWEQTGREGEEPDPEEYHIFVQKNKGHTGGITLRFDKKFLRLYSPEDPEISSTKAPVPQNGYQPF